MNYIAIAGLKFKGRFEDTPTGISLPKRQERILQTVMHHYDVSWEDMIARCRKRKVLVPRQVAMYLLHKMLGMGCVDVGNLFNMDHTTDIHTFALIQDLIDTNEDFRNEIRGIKENIL